MDINLKVSNVYNMMMQRCYNPKMSNYKNYGGRGIYVDQEWLDHPERFRKWYKDNYFDGCQVDRIDNDGPYSPDNCRLASPTANSRNRRNTNFIEAFGEKKNAAAWVEDERCHVKDWRNLLKRIECGVDPELAMSEDYKQDRYRRASSAQRKTAPQIQAFGESKCLIEWVEDDRCSISRKLLHSRIKAGWNPEKAITKPARAIKQR